MSIDLTDPDECTDCAGTGTVYDSKGECEEVCHKCCGIGVVNGKARTTLEAQLTKQTPNENN